VHFEVSLLNTRNMVFSKILAILIKFRTHYPDSPIQTLRMDNAKEFRAQQFEDYCVASGITLTYAVPYEHAQNGLAEAFIKKIQLISRPLLLHAKLPSHFWSHAVLHAATLLKYRPTLLNDHSPLELLSSQVPNVSHFHIFGCRVWVPIAEPQQKTIGRHRQEGIYVGFDSPSIIRYVSPSTGVLHKARFQNCQFDESHFPPLVSSQPSPSLEFWAPETFTMNPDPRTALADSEVKKLLTLKALAEKLPDGFSNSSRITRNPLPGVGQPALSILPAKRSSETPQAIVKQTRLSPEGHHALPSTWAASGHRSEPEVQVQAMAGFPPPELTLLLSYTSKEANSVQSFVSSLIPLESDPLTLEGAKASSDWPQWQAALNTEYASLRKHNVFGPLVTNLASKPVGFRLIFTKKRNAEGQVVRYKVRLVAQGFSQRPGIDYTFTYSPVMDSGTFRYLLGMAVQYSLDTQLLDVVTAYLYGPLDADIHIRIPPDFLKADPFEDTLGSYSGPKLQKALYGLKQVSRMWYQHLREFLLHHDFRHDQALPCIFTFKNSTGFVVVAVYVDNLNLVGTPETCTYVVSLLITQFEMKLLGKTSFFIGLQVTHLPDGSIFLHQTGYTQKLLKRFGMDKANPLSAPMMGHSKTSDDPYRPCEEEEEEFYDRTRYLAAVGPRYTCPPSLARTYPSLSAC
jgi:hypothetical protein